MAVVYRCVGILTVNVVVFFQNPGVFHSLDSFPLTFHPWLWETSSGEVTVCVFVYLLQRLNIDNQDPNTPIDHGHLAQNCSIKIIMLAVKASVISILNNIIIQHVPISIIKEIAVTSELIQIYR